jgi:hypothetical protein
LYRDDVDAIEEILAEPAVGHHSGQILVGGGNDAHRRLELFNAAEPAELPLLQHAQELHLHRRGHLADFVEEQRPLLRRLDEPFLVAAGARERAFHVAEQLRFEERFGQGAAVEGDERTIAPQRIEVDGARHPFLAGARFAGHEHRALGAGDLLDELEDREHLLAAPDDVGELVARAERPLQQHVLLPEAALLEGVADLHLQLVDVERLAEVVVGSQPHRFDGGVGRREGGNHDAEHVLIDALGGPQYFDAAHVGHLDVGNEEVEAAALELVDRLLAVFGKDDIVPLAAQHDRQQLAHRPLVVHDEQARGAGSGFRAARSGFGVVEFFVQGHSVRLLTRLYVLAPIGTRAGRRTLTIVPFPGVELT